MTFDDIIEDGRLWAVRYDGDEDNVLYSLFDRWNDVAWLRNFFKENIDDLQSYFKITDVNEAIMDTIDDSDRLQALILDLSPDADLDKLFRPLENLRQPNMLLSKEKARVKSEYKHPSWLRIYAIRLEKDSYIITGGAIKLTAKMEERAHTLNELLKMEKVRQFLIEENVVDKDSFADYMSEIS